MSDDNCSQTWVKVDGHIAIQIQLIFAQSASNYNKSKVYLMSDLMCVKCNKFFGNAQNHNMCSVCFKQKKEEEGIKDEVTNFKMPELPEQPQSKQENHSRCYTCNKKIGLLGFRCNSCDCSYCNVHRLPEEHKCEGNFIEHAKQEIKKKNPNITAPKIEQI